MSRASAAGNRNTAYVYIHVYIVYLSLSALGFFLKPSRTSARESIYFTASERASAPMFDLSVRLRDERTDSRRKLLFPGVGSQRTHTHTYMYATL